MKKVFITTAAILCISYYHDNEYYNRLCYQNFFG